MSLRKNILWHSLSDLSSRERQKQLWLGLIPGQMGTFEEAWAGVFDDSGLWYLYDDDDFLIEYGSETVQLIIQLRSLLRKIPLQVDPSQIIDLPDMEDIRKISKQLLESPIFKNFDASSF